MNLSSIDFSTMKLGRISPPASHKIQTFASLALDSLSSIKIPDQIDWYSKVENWHMYDNDKIGDCAEAGVGHVLHQWTKYAKPTPMIMTDSDVIDLYSRAGGYNPSDPSSDNGTILSILLSMWANNGVTVNTGLPNQSTNILAGFKAIPNNIDVIKRSIAVFGNVYWGVSLPLSAQTQTTWDYVPNTPNNAFGSWGGHLVPIVGYTNNNTFICVSWGRLIEMTSFFLTAYWEEGYSLISPDFIDSHGLSPSGFNWQSIVHAEQTI